MTATEPAIARYLVQVLAIILVFRGALGFVADYKAWERGWLGRRVFRWMRPIVRDHPWTMPTLSNGVKEKPMIIEVELTEPALEALQRLVDTGFYGGSVEGAAERVICRWLDDREADRVRVLDLPERCPASKDGKHFPGCGCD
jgi:hypothetical protein